MGFPQATSPPYPEGKARPMHIPSPPVMLGQDQLWRAGLGHEYAGMIASARQALIDLEMGKRIEVEALQGAAVRRATRHNLPLPIISTLYSVLRPYAAGPAKRPADSR